MSTIHLWHLDAQKKALLQKAIAPRCSQKKRAQYLEEAEKIQSEIFRQWRENMAAQVARALGVASPKRD